MAKTATEIMLAYLEREPVMSYEECEELDRQEQRQELNTEILLQGARNLKTFNHRL